MINRLKEKYGNKCTSIKINYKGPCKNSPAIKMRFCEAVSYSFNVPLSINGDTLSCLGSQRSFGLLKNDDEIANHISLEIGISLELIKQSLIDIPKFEEPIKSILLGIQEHMEDQIKPDLFILHLSPKDAMDLMKEYTSKTSIAPVIKPVTYLSVCGNILTQTYKYNRMSISFGCPDSREYGGVSKNDVIVGIPYSECNNLFNN